MLHFAAPPASGEYRMSSLVSLFRSVATYCFARLDCAFKRLLAPPPTRVWHGALQDLPRCKTELVLENALLRHQLSILHRQCKPAQLTSSDRFWLLLLASRLSHWKEAFLILKPETLLRWH